MLITIDVDFMHHLFAFQTVKKSFIRFLFITKILLLIYFLLLSYTITVPTVAIIGAGPSGLTAAKAAIECGLSPSIFEKSSNLGGLWKSETRYVWNELHTNLSRHTCIFSDFP